MSFRRYGRDNRVSAKDSVILQRYLAGWKIEINLDAADVDSNGAVNAVDAIILERHLAQWSGYEKFGK